MDATRIGVGGAGTMGRGIAQGMSAMCDPPAEIGLPLTDVDTPALVIDLDAFERNLAEMAKRVSAAGVRIRPHAKTHKCAVIARQQMALGAVGVCCQKVSEAEALVRAGVPDVLVSNQVVGRRKIDRLVALAREARMGVCVDDAGNAVALGEAASAAGITLDVLVEIDVGAGRCGVAPGDEALALARGVASIDGLRFAGLQAYHGRAQHIRDYAERERAIESAASMTRATVAALAQTGIECETVAGAGTGTWQFEAASGIYNELQAGSYVFMDVDYAKNLDAAGGPFADFEHSLFVYSTVMSRPARERAVLDAGLKAFATDCGMPRMADLESVVVLNASDEHAVVDLTASNANLGVGDKVRLIPGHCDPTVNLHDWYVCVRDNRVEALWPIVARGCVW
ncbi:MAG: DSD1 family PLP-dependent enzyme [Thiotrichales bacterium]|nr:DSD1 family PLP-dependent enzyme [Thiotrichales bacterium]